MNNSDLRGVEFVNHIKEVQTRRQSGHWPHSITISMCVIIFHTQGSEIEFLKAITMHNLNHQIHHTTQSQTHFGWGDMNPQQAFSR